MKTRFELAALSVKQVLSWLGMAIAVAAVGAEDLTTLCADRAAIERVYHVHRLGDKSSFDEALPPATLEKLVRRDSHKEAVLKKVYGVEVTPAALDAEVQRINTTTRAPAVLAEIKTALGSDPVRFANAFAKPILVERLLREKFDNDDRLHAPSRRQFEQTRDALLAARANGADSDALLMLLRCGHSDAVTQATWQLGVRPVETNAPSADEIEIKNRFGPSAQLLSSPRADGKEQKRYFADLPTELQNVLHVQLRQTGDVSAVIEAPGGFLLYLCQEKTIDILSVATLALPKCSYDEWLESEIKP